MLFTQDFPPEVEAQMRKDAARFGEPLPKRIVNKPSLRLGLAMYYNAWFDLDSDRPVNDSGIGRIPYMAIFEYANAYEFNDRQTDELIRYVRSMDRAYINSVRSKTPTPKTGKGKRIG